ncbi:MAG: AraC family transcriptional regulator [Ruminococcus sp.]|nr:AraC family transcriptional regulator [Ruminococcus sp.]MBP1565456.1 helix-turn-helix transcriptional regulator [Oscillospiraceae bacterium]
MHNLFEQSDALNSPLECFFFDTSEKTFPIKPHWHYFMEIIYVMEGTAKMYSDENEYIVSKEEMIIFHPQTVHSIYKADDSKLRYAVFKFDINKIYTAISYAPKLRSIFKSAQKKNMIIHFSAMQTKMMDCKAVFTDCILEHTEQKYGYELVLRSRLNILLTNIIRLWQCNGFSIDTDIFANDSGYDIDSITEYIDMHICENIQVNDIAEKCGLSYSCFAKKFRLLYNMSCKEYIEIMRIFKVEEFLLFTDFDLNYISQETGFSDCSHMIKSFKKHRQCTPKQFRLNHKRTF